MDSTLQELLMLQNGNDIRGVALGGIKGEPVNFTGETAQKIACAFTARLAEKLSKSPSDMKIGVGHDSRLSAAFLKGGVLAGIAQAGAKAVDCGLASTPAMYMGTVLEASAFDGTLMITASHLPFNRNGMKFFDKTGSLEKTDIRQLLESAATLKNTPMASVSAQKLDLISLYTDFLCEKIKAGVNAPVYDKPLDGLAIVLNASNGSGGFFEKQVLRRLGANTAGSINLEPDGRFPNHTPNPEDPAAMAALQAAVLKAGADLGIIFDTDVDRAAVVFEDGSAINRNKIVALTAAITAKTNPATTVVTDSVTSDQLTDFIENKLHMRHRRFKRGYKNVINEAIRLNSENVESWLAVETSGHCAFKENYFLDDGAYMSVKILIETALAKRAGRPLSTLIDGLGEPAESHEFRLTIKCGAFAPYGETVLDKLTGFAAKQGLTPAPDSHEGKRLSFQREGASGWLLLRLSLHDPLLALNIETLEEGGVARLCKILLPFFEEFEMLDIFQIVNFIS